MSPPRWRRSCRSTLPPGTGVVLDLLEVSVAWYGVFRPVRYTVLASRAPRVRQVAGNRVVGSTCLLSCRVLRLVPLVFPFIRGHCPSMRGKYDETASTPRAWQVRTCRHVAGTAEHADRVHQHTQQVSRCGPSRGTRRCRSCCGCRQASRVSAWLGLPWSRGTRS